MKNIKYLAFVKSVDTGSFSKAGELLGYTQSGITHMMDRFEEEIGFPLIQRGFYGIRPTEKGKELLPIIRELIDKEQALQDKIDAIKENDSNTIRVGAYSSVAVNWLPYIIESFNKKYPNVRIKFQTGSVSALYNGIENNLFDLVFVSRSENCTVKFIPLKKDKMVAVLPKNYAGKLDNGHFDVSNFDGKRFLMPGLGFKMDITRIFKKSGVLPNIEETFLDDIAIMAMVEHGFGISMLSELVVKGRDSGVLTAPIYPEQDRTLGIAFLSDKQTPDFVKGFIDCAVDYVNQNG